MTDRAADRTLHWAAGVLDAAAVFRVRARDERIWSCSVHVRATRGVCERLRALLGGGVQPLARSYEWRLPADDQERLLLVVPHMRDEAKVEQARAIISFRLTGAKRRVGWVTTPAVRQHRRKALRRMQKALAAQRPT